MKKYLPLFFFLIVISTFSIVITASSNSLFIISPLSGTYHYGQQLKLIAKYTPNTVVIVSLITPNSNKITIGNYNFNSSGYLTVNIGTFGSGYLVEAGNYLVIVTLSNDYSYQVPIKYAPFYGILTVKVQNTYDTPLSNANVYLYNISNSSSVPLYNAQTNSTGYAVLNVSFTSNTQSFEVVASYPGYFNSTATVTLSSNSVTDITLTLNPYNLTTLVVGVQQGNLVIDPINPSGYTSVIATEGENTSVFIETLFNHSQIINAQVSVRVITPVKEITITSAPVNNNGYYVASFQLPLLNISYEAVLQISVTFASIKTVTVVPIVVQINNTELEHQFENQIASMNKNITEMQNEIAELNSALIKLTNQSILMQNSINNLEKIANISNEEIIALNNQVNEQGIKLNQVSTFVYIALIIGVLGLVLAIIDLINIRRALS